MKQFLSITFLALLVCSETTRAEAPTPRVDFRRDVQPIFRRHCYRCHGPKKARGRLQLSSRKAVLSKQDPDEPLIVAGKPEKSHLLIRLTDAKAGDIMPLDGQRLSKRELDVLRQWIKSGANWPDDQAEDRHWAYVQPALPTLPEVKLKDWPVNAVDYFTLAQMEAEQLTPSDPEERGRLLRRVSLALIGIPPTPEEVEAFVNDKSPNAYEKVVDRLLASPRYGERWAQHWLDLARYADSNGFQADQLRDSWAFRDYVIRAFNNDKPFDQFTIEQLAGDLIPNATVEQKIATGFHRATTCNVEAGVHPEANRVNQIFDRISTTGTVFLGTTLECSQCHDHKYDPFTQKEYYQIFAYFNNTPLEVVGNNGVQFEFGGPTMQLPLPPGKKQKMDELQAKLDEQMAVLKKVRETQLKQLPDWERRITKALQSGPAVWKDLTPTKFTSTGREDHEMLKDGSVLLSGSVPGTAIYELHFNGALKDVIGIKVHALTHESIPGKGPGRGDAEKTNIILNEVDLVVARGPKGEAEEISLHDATASFSQNRWPVANAIDGNRKTGWAIAPKFHQDHFASFRTKEPLQLGEDDRLIVKLDQNFGRGRVMGRVKISVLTGDPLLANLPADLIPILKKQKNKRKPKEVKKLRDHFMAFDPRIEQITKATQNLRKQMALVKPPTTLVMVENDAPRMTHLMKRGDYLNKGEQVKPATPETLHPLDPKLPKSRLGFAKWLVSQENPLLARVTVNRWWREIYGQGIVTTPEDFGTQGEWPTHPKLLDWLAVRFMEDGWSMKKIHKTMVMASTYRQSSRITSELAARDPQNRLYARGPRFRLPAETIRDNALTISGLLTTQMYGAPIMPYQPDGIWKAVGRNQPTWKTATDENRSRRGVYVVWKRGAPYAAFINFDAPDRAACMAQRPRTNTPLQALNLLNDPAYVEMALALAQRMMSERDKPTLESCVERGFELTLARKPTSREVQIVLRLYQREMAKLKADPKLVQMRVKNMLSTLRKPEVNETELAAWFIVANALLNLDETITN